MKDEPTAGPAAAEQQLESALNAVLSQSRPPQNLRRLIIAAIHSAEREGVVGAIRLIEADVVENRASND